MGGSWTHGSWRWTLNRWLSTPLHGIAPSSMWFKWVICAEKCNINLPIVEMQCRQIPVSATFLNGIITLGDMCNATFWMRSIKLRREQYPNRTDDVVLSHQLLCSHLLFTFDAHTHDVIISWNFLVKVPCTNKVPWKQPSWSSFFLSKMHAVILLFYQLSFSKWVFFTKAKLYLLLPLSLLGNLPYEYKSPW